MFQYILGVIPIFHVLDSSIQSSWFCVRDSNCSNLYIRSQIHSNSDECLYNYCTRIIIKSLFGLFLFDHIINCWEMTCSYLNLSFALALWLKYRSRQIATTTITGNITIEHIIGMITVCGGTVMKKNCESNILTNCYWNHGLGNPKNNVILITCWIYDNCRSRSCDPR